MPWGVRTIIWWLATAWLCGVGPCAAPPAAAQAGTVGRPVTPCIARVQPGETLADAIAGRVRFDCTVTQTMLGAGDFWVSTPPGTDAAGQRLRVASVWHERSTLAVVHADGHVDTIVADNRGVARRIQLGAIVEYPLPDRGVAITRLIWRVEGAANRRGVLIGARIATSEQSARSNLVMATIYAAFGGLCVALIVYNLALWGALRHRFQLAYCLMVSMLLGYALSSSGALAWMLPGIANNDRLRVNYLTLGGSAAAALWFARTFFERRVFERGLGRVTDGVAIALVVVSVLFALLAHRWMREFDFLYSAVFATVLLLVPAIVWRAWATQSRYLWLFGIAWAAPVAMAGVRVAHNFNLVQWSFWLDQSTIIAMTAEALLSSLAIAYRIRLLSSERDEAIAQESASRKLAEIDPLTSLLNRRAFLANAIGRAGRQQLILVDIDHFKRVNDTLGHDGGDEVLRVFARALRAAAPPGAQVARIGGEEFAIVSDSAAQFDATALLAELRATRMPFDLRVTASLGVCIGPLDSEADWKRLYRCADQALFEAKAQGRDRVRSGEKLAAVA